MNYVIYPYCDDFLPILKKIPSYREDLEVSEVVYPRAWERRISKLKHCIKSSSDFYHALTTAQGVIIIDTLYTSLMYSDILNKIKATLELGKAVICLVEIKDCDLEILKKDVNFTYLTTSININQDRLFRKIDCPVIVIGNLLRKMDQSEIICNLDFLFRKKGYLTSSISPNRNTQLLGFNYFNDPSLFEESFEPDLVINDYNQYFNNIQEKFHSDVMLVQFSDGMIKYSDKCFEGYGVKSFLLSQALDVDYFILNVPFNGSETGNYDSLNDLFKYRFGYEIDKISVEDISVDESTSQEDNIVTFQSEDSALISNYINDINFHKRGMFFYLHDSNAYEKIFDDITTKLSGDIEEF